jgi:formylglycine-generating enzyme required for sulfatase activity
MILSRFSGTVILNIFRLTIAITSLIAFLIFVIAPFNGAIAAPPTFPDGMASIPKGTFTIGSDIYYPSEASAVDVTVESFCLDLHEITNAEYRQFVEATGYKTVAERPIPKDEFPDLIEEQRQPGSLVFWPPESLEQMTYLSWWHWVVGANWQHPDGPESTLAGLDDYPVVHIAYEDAIAYANWVGKSLPTEAQWEYAARGGLDGDAIVPREQYAPTKANTWQGLFPFWNTHEDGYLGPAPVQSFEPNGYGLYDMLGNVWELTADWYRTGHPDKNGSLNPTGPDFASSFDPEKPEEGALHVIKGGSFLCAPNYCSRYRPEARESQAPDTGTNHVGFRLVQNL